MAQYGFTADYMEMDKNGYIYISAGDEQSDMGLSTFGATAR